MGELGCELNILRAEELVLLDDLLQVAALFLQFLIELVELLGLGRELREQLSLLLLPFCPKLRKIVSQFLL